MSTNAVLFLNTMELSKMKIYWNICYQTQVSLRSSCKL